MSRLQLNDWLEGICILAIVASLIFVGLQMRQAQDIALGEAFLSLMSSRIELGNSIKDDVDIWMKGAAGEELLNEESAVFAVLVNQVNDFKFYTYAQRVQLNGREASEYIIHDFALILYHNSGALPVWRARSNDIVKGRELLNPESNVPSRWSEGVEEAIAVLESKGIPIGNGSPIKW